MATFGIGVFRSTLIDVVLKGSPADENGLKAGDRILRLNGAWVDSTSFRSTIQEVDPSAALTLAVERDGEVIDLDLMTKTNGTFEDIAFNPTLGLVVAIRNEEPQEVRLENSEFTARTTLKSGERVSAVNGSSDVGTELRKLLEIDPSAEIEISVLPPKTRFFGSASETPRTVTASVFDIINGITGTDSTKKIEIAGIDDVLAESTGLKRQDVITHIDGQEATVTHMENIRSNRVGETVPITVHRRSILFGFYQEEETIETELTIGSIQQVGVVWANEKIFHKQEPANVIPYAYNECIRRSTEIGKTLGKLVTGGISPKLLGGPVLIYEMTTASARLSFYDLLSMVAMISVNLCIFNLLPLPVLDGGQLTIIAIEAIRRRPVSTRILENVQQAGFFFILGLLVFVTFNDVSRIIERILP
jgi:regulator of sigma E protease